MKNLLTLKLYVRVARLGSFSAAAREHNLTQSQVSRMIAELEAELGVRLLARTTRAVVPTEAGSEFLSKIEPILAALDDAANSVRETGELRGTLRIAMPSTMGINVIIPRMSVFAERHPDLHIDILLDDKWQDMVREAIDVGIRVGSLPDSSGIARMIGKMRRVIVASPAYIAKRGPPKHPLDIKNYCIIAGPAASHVTSWQFERDGEQITVDVQSKITTNDTAGAVAAAVGSLGITSTTSWACKRELQAGSLLELVPEWKTAELPVHAYLPAGRTARVAARAFVDFISVEMQHI